MNYSAILSNINAQITTNGTGAITGAVLNTVLRNILSNDIRQAAYITDGNDSPNNGVISLNFVQRKLFDNTGTGISIDWSNRLLYKADGTTISWATGFMYASTIGDSVTTVAVGGVAAGTTAATLKAMTQIQVLDAILFPDQAPTYSIPLLSLTLSVLSIEEVGATVSELITVVGTSNDAGPFTSIGIYKNASLLNTPSLTAATITNIPDQFGYTNPNSPNHNYTGTYTDSLVVALGNTTYTAKGAYNPGSAKKNNKGVTDPRTAAIRSTNAPQASDSNYTTGGLTVVGLYPYFWGVSNSAPTAASIAAALGSANKVVADSSGSINITFAASGQYLWFAVPNRSAFSTWYVNALNNGAIGGGTNLFGTGVNQSFNSPTSLWSAETYNVYISNFVTTTSGVMTLA